jgi:nickel/cobalt transporter (NicO) family protein
MDAGELALVASAAMLGAVHTLLGVDHTVPILALSRAEGWKLRKTLAATTLLAALHVGSAALIFSFAKSFGWPLAKLFHIEGARGQWALRLLVLFGFVYGTLALIRVLWRPMENRIVKANTVSGARLAPFLPYGVAVSVLGPCEPLLPLLTAGQAVSSLALRLATLAAFSLATLITMLLVVGLGFLGLEKAGRRFDILRRLAPHSHVLAGYGVCLTALVLL